MQYQQRPLRGDVYGSGNHIPEEIGNGMRSIGRDIGRGMHAAAKWAEPELAKLGRETVRAGRWVEAETGKALRAGERDAVIAGKFIAKEGKEALHWTEQKGRQALTWAENEARRMMKSVTPVRQQLDDDFSVNTRDNTPRIAHSAVQPRENAMPRGYIPSHVQPRDDEEPPERAPQRFAHTVKPTLNEDMDTASRRYNPSHVQPRDDEDDEMYQDTQQQRLRKACDKPRACSITAAEYAEYCRIFYNTYNLRDVVASTSELDCTAEIDGCCVRVGEFIPQYDLGVIQVVNDSAEPMRMSCFSMSQLKAMITTDRPGPAVECADKDECCEWCPSIAPHVFPLSCSNGNMTSCAITFAPDTTTTMIVLKDKTGPSFCLDRARSHKLLQQATVFSGNY